MLAVNRSPLLHLRLGTPVVVAISLTFIRKFFMMIPCNDLHNKEVQGTIKQGQEFGNSQIKVQNQQIGTEVLHTRESAHQLAMVSHARVEHAPTTA